MTRTHEHTTRFGGGEKREKNEFSFGLCRLRICGTMRMAGLGLRCCHFMFQIFFPSFFFFLFSLWWSGGHTHNLVGTACREKGQKQRRCLAVYRSFFPRLCSVEKGKNVKKKKHPKSHKKRGNTAAIPSPVLFFRLSVLAQRSALFCVWPLHQRHFFSSGRAWPVPPETSSSFFLKPKRPSNNTPLVHHYLQTIKTNGFGRMRPPVPRATAPKKGEPTRSDRARHRHFSFLSPSTPTSKHAYRRHR